MLDDIGGKYLQPVLTSVGFLCVMFEIKNRGPLQEVTVSKTVGVDAGPLRLRIGILPTVGILFLGKLY